MTKYKVITSKGELILKTNSYIEANHYKKFVTMKGYKIIQYFSGQNKIKQYANL